MSRARYHGKRIGLAILRLALYSCVCGMFFMIGMQMGRRDTEQKSGKNRTEDGEETDYGDVGAKDGDFKGILPLPYQHKPGEMGKAYKPTKLTEEQKKLMKDGWQKNAINQYVSDLISVDRSLPDMRHPNCKTPGRYLTNLPKASVIICFHNEAWSILLRSVHSIINRTPAELLKEIILVDDASTMDHLKAQLENYMKRFGQVRIIRAPKRVGLIRARILGATNSKGKVLIFLDSHIEASPGWMQPLLDRIARNFTTVVCPTIDVIDDDTFAYNYDSNFESAVHSIGIFDWSLTFNWRLMPVRQRILYNDTSQPYQSPAMAGGLFGISKRFFEYLGYYDPEMDIWGGENLELSFKTWMCGGTLEIVPCSRVGHIFRHRSPYEWRSGVNVLKKNLVRLAKVWTDEYAKYYLQKINNDVGDYGDISDRLELRKRLKCKSFKWYIKNVYPEVFIPDNGYAFGEIRNLGLGGKTCLDAALDSSKSVPISLYPCHRMGGNQAWSYTQEFEIRRDDICVDYAGDKVMSFGCHGSHGNQEWRYDFQTKRLVHQVYQKCMMAETTKTLVMSVCSEDERQKWMLENYRKSIPNMTIDSVEAS